MTSPLAPWASGPFELLVHAEGHLREGDDLDRRIALISFDNAIEVSIATYLTLNPIQRGGRSYPRDQVDAWMTNFHTKLDFLESEIDARNLAWSVERTHIIWVHDHRNEQYHGGRKGTPERSVLELARTAALWVFSLLFDVSDPESEIEGALASKMAPAEPRRDRAFDVAIDALYGVIEVGEQNYYTSELLFAVDPPAYRDLGGKLGASEAPSPKDEGEER